MKSNLKQITPRLCQNKVLRVYPLVPGLAVMRKIDKWEFVDVPGERNQLIAGVIFSGKQELIFQLSLKVIERGECQFRAKLFSIHDGDNNFVRPEKIYIPVKPGRVVQLDMVVILKSNGACILSTDRKKFDGLNLPFKGPFPWILKIGASHSQPVSMVLHCE